VKSLDLKEKNSFSLTKYFPFNLVKLEKKRKEEREAEKAAKQLLLEYGATGTRILAGIIQEEYETKLAALPNRIEQFDQMRKSDPTVAACLLVFELPILAATWFIQAASEQEEDKTIAKFISNNLFEEVSITWNDFLRHVLLILPFGFNIFEKVFKLDEETGLIKWKKFAPRLPQTLNQWLLDEEGGLAGIVQEVYIANEYRLVEIPVEKLLVFTYRREGSNFEGVSLLRAAYRSWWTKDKLLKIQAIGLERNAIGTPTIGLPDEYTSRDLEMAKDIVRAWRAHEQMGFIRPPGFVFESSNVEMKAEALQNAISYYDHQIEKSMLSNFLGLGEARKGSYALSKTLKEIYMLALQAIGKDICDTFNKYAIQKLVDLNWPDRKRYPKLTVKGLGELDRETMSEIVERLQRSGFLTADEGLEDFFRKSLDLPEKKMEETKIGVKETTFEEELQVLCEKYNIKKEQLYKKDNKTTMRFLGR